ncbi:MAG: UDP-N-acetylmuramoyl-L-alanyl-D-glutamate--2,6-diaminopimelate ligase [Candidatus Zixiibacteriota bacterium]|nr:MAG: UDP-N-acetylmuramoyl-L-alanyl-D-glutamate--2,6-diaminopimelate ligase [candidate division Zixibacteria bacterium]
MINGNPQVEIENVQYDSRLIKPDGLFIAVKGFKQNGYDFVDQATRNGAVAVMGERSEVHGIDTHVTVPDVRKAMATVGAEFYGYPGLKMTAYGVTGTNGKTTTCYLLKNILRAAGVVTGMVTSQVYDNGSESFRAERTTPESLDLQRLLAQMVRNDCTSAVIEVSSHALILSRVEHIDFKVAVYTNITRDHLDFHKTMDEYLRAKSMLAERVAAAKGRVVVNLDVAEFRPLLKLKQATVTTYSLEDSEADVYCRSYDIRPDGTSMELVTPAGSATVDYRLAGRFNLANGVAAVAAGVAGEIDTAAIVKGLEAASSVPGRFNYIGCGQPFAIYIDYAHTPDAIERLCQSAREISTGRLMILFGCGGDRDRGKRPLMGKAATEHADYAVVTSDNPRSEDPADIIEDIKPGLAGNNYEICPDRAEAIGKVIEMAEPGDVVLLAGKGDENYQEILGTRHPFSDSEEAMKTLARLGYNQVDTEREN